MRPIHDMLLAASGRRSGHMPGHKGRAPFGAEDLYALDTTEIPLTDDLYAPENGIAQAQELYARAAGAGATIFLHNGSTAGIHAMVQLYAGEGDTVILPRNAHLSAANGCVLGGVRAEWIPITQRADGYCYIAEADVLAALDAYPEAKALLLTRPELPYIATNPDLVCPTEFGSVPDCGSVCQMIFNATGTRPVVIGKPSPLMPQLAMEAYGVSVDEACVVGDRIYTDVKSGLNAGITSILVLSGETTQEILDESIDKPHIVLQDASQILAALKETV